MLGKLTERSEKRTEAFAMTTSEQASRLLQDLAEPRPVGDTVKAAITRAARAVSAVSQEPMSYGRAEDIWRKEARRIDAAEMDAIRLAHERRNRALRDELAEARALAVYLEGLATSLLAPARGGQDGGFSAAAREIRAGADDARRAAHSLRVAVAMNDEVIR